MEKKKPKILFLNKNQILSHNRKYKEDDGMMYTKLMASIELYGQIQPILVKKINDNYEIINGSRIFDVMKQLQYDEYFCLEIEDELDICDIIVNELNFKTNYIELSEKLLSKNIHELSRYLPYTGEQIEKIKSISSYDWSKIIRKENELQVSLFDSEDENLDSSLSIDLFPEDLEEFNNENKNTNE